MENCVSKAKQLSERQPLRGILVGFRYNWVSLVSQMVKNPHAVQKTRVRSLNWDDSLGEGNGYPLQDSCLENLMARGAW